MTQSHNPPSECQRLGGAGPTHKALRTVHRTAVSGMWVNGTCLCDPVSASLAVSVFQFLARVREKSLQIIYTLYTIASNA